MIDEIYEAAKKQIKDYTSSVPFWQQELIEKYLKEAIDLGYKQGQDEVKALIEKAYKQGREDAKYYQSGPFKAKSLYDK